MGTSWAYKCIGGYEGLADYHTLSHSCVAVKELKLSYHNSHLYIYIHILQLI